MNKKQLIDILVSKYHYNRAGLSACTNKQLIKIATREGITTILYL